MRDQKPPKKHHRILAILIIIVILLAILGYYSHYKKTAPLPATPTTQQTTPTQTLLPAPRTLNPFSLTDDAGNPLTNANLKGHWSLMFFGFTHCGDVCPTTLTELNKMYQQLQKDLPADRLPQIIFVSVDPERDTQPVLHNYIKNYNPNFIGATGNSDNLNVFVKDLGVYFHKKPSQDANTYDMEHSPQIYLFNPDGNWVGILTYPQQAEQLTQNYQALLNTKTTT